MTNLVLVVKSKALYYAKPPDNVFDGNVDWWYIHMFFSSLLTDFSVAYYMKYLSYLLSLTN